MDRTLRRRIRDGTVTYRDWARAGLARVFLWDGNGDGHGDGHGDGSGYGTGNGTGNGHGDGNGHGHGNGSGDGNGHGNGDGSGNGSGHGNGDGGGNGSGDGTGNGHGNGDGSGSGNGDGNGNGNGTGTGNGSGYGTGEPSKESLVKISDVIPLQSPVVLRSYTSGVIVGRLEGGENGTAAVSNWRWLRRWTGVGNEGSVYDLVNSTVSPSRRGPFTPTVGVFQEADVMVISEEAYVRLSGDS